MGAGCVIKGTSYQEFERPSNIAVASHNRVFSFPVMIDQFNRGTGIAFLALSFACLALHPLAQAADTQSELGNDWPQFRGPGALGRSEAKGLPLTWSDEKGVAWKTTLPGPGASSPIVIGNRIFLTCFTGFVWRGGGIKDSWHAPVFVNAPDGKTEVVLAMFRKVLAFDPDKGEQLWNCDTGINWYMCPTPVAENGIVYSIGGRNPNGALAIRAGGRGDITASHIVWKLNKGSNVPSPILHDGHLYFAHENLGIVYCVNAKSGEVAYEERLEPSPGQIYASPVLADGRGYFTGRSGRTIVIAARPKFEKLADNTLESNRGVFNSSAAVSGNRLLLRSDRALYCIGNK